MSKFCCLVLLVSMFAMPVMAQQANTAGVASLTVAGIGASGPGPFAVQLPPGVATNTAFTFGGAANVPFALVNANPSLGGTVAVGGGIPTPFGIVDLAPLAFPPLEFSLDGFSATGLLAALLNTGTTGSTTLTFTLSNGVCPFVVANVQAAVATVAPPGLALTAAFSLGALVVPADAGPVAVTPAAGDDTTHPYGYAGGCPGTVSFPFYGVARTGYNINSNGNISFGGSNTAFSETQSGFQSGLAKICPAWDDYNFSTSPAGAALTKFDSGTTVAVAWTGVSEFGAAGTLNTFTCTMVVATGDIVCTYGAMSSLDMLTGITSGGGAVATVFGPAAVNGRISSHIGGGPVYVGAVGETMDELFVSPATATAGTNNLASGPSITWMAGPGATAYSMF